MRHSVNVGVTLREGEGADKLIKRFFKKCKKVDIVREYLEKTAYFRSPSRKRKDKIQKNRHLRKIEQLKFEKKMNGRR